jgi:uncharacterized protein DUF1236
MKTLPIAALVLISGMGLASAASSSSTTPSSTSSMGQQTAKDSLSLSKAQERTAWNDISKEGSKQSAPSNFTAFVGAQVPGSINLHSMPADVASQVPALKPYDYALLQERLLIINPSDKKVVDVIRSQA